MSNLKRVPQGYALIEANRPFFAEELGLCFRLLCVQCPEGGGLSRTIFSDCFGLLELRNSSPIAHQGQVVKECAYLWGSCIPTGFSWSLESKREELVSGFRKALGTWLIACAHGLLQRSWGVPWPGLEDPTAAHANQLQPGSRGISIGLGRKGGWAMLDSSTHQLHQGCRAVLQPTPHRL